MEYGSPAPLIAFAIAVVCGALLASGSYVGGAITGALAILLGGVWRWGQRQQDDDRHTLW